MRPSPNQSPPNHHYGQAEKGPARAALHRRVNRRVQWGTPGNVSGAPSFERERPVIDFGQRAENERDGERNDRASPSPERTADAKPTTALGLEDLARARLEAGHG